MGSRSAIHQIITLNTVVQCRKEFQGPIWIAFVDLKAAFDSLEELEAVTQPWLGFTQRLHSKVVDLMEALYMDTCSCVCADGVLSDWFALGSGVRQGCKIASDLFLGPMDHMMERTAH